MFTVRKLNIRHILALPKVICRLRATPVRIPAAFVAEIDQLILKFMQNARDPE